ncbi:MAG: penicillin acylase family protein [Gemmatimonadaceae bacterium]
MRFLCAVAALLAASSVQAQTLEQLARSSLAQIDGRVALRGLKEQVEVIRDRWGVPHLYARNIDDLFFAQGFVQAQDRLWQMEMYRRTYGGSLAEIMGPSYVRHDQLARLLKFRGPFDDSEWKSYHPEGQRIFEAFADGVNAYIAHAGDRLPVEFQLTGLRPGLWTPEIALLRTTTALPVANATSELRLARDVARVGVDSANRAARPSPHRDLVVPDGVDHSIIDDEVIAALTALRGGVVRPPMLPEYRAMSDASDNRGVQENSPGSNNWVTSARLSANGHVVVANDPHRNVANPSIRYIVHLNAPGWNVIGATEAVLPGVMIGHTERIGWGLTIVGTDQSDVYVEETHPANRTQVRFRGRWEPMRVVIDTILVKGAAPVVVTHKFTRHGPVFYEDTVRRKAYAMRTTAHLPGSAGYLSALRYHALEDCEQFLDAQRYYLAPTENMVCGDTKGNIAWQASAASPKRPNWHGRLPVPGTGEYEWDGLRTDLPRELNPERGWIATANHDIHPPNYDPPLYFKNTPQDARYRRLAEVLSSAKAMTLGDHMALQHDALNARALADTRLFRGWTSSDPDIEWSRQQLAAWDGQHRRESAAPALYRYASRAIDADARALGPGNAGSRIERAIRIAIDSLRATQGADRAQWRWGRINRSELPHSLVSAYDAPPVERHGGAGFVAAVGATYRQVIDMNDLDASMATNVPGQSGQPFSPFYRNLVDSFGRGEYFPMVFSRAAVEQAAAHRLQLVPAP